VPLPLSASLSDPRFVVWRQKWDCQDKNIKRPEDLIIKAGAGTSPLPPPSPSRSFQHHGRDPEREAHIQEGTFWYVSANHHTISFNTALGYPEPDVHTATDTSETIDVDSVPLDGGFLVKTFVLSVDPYLRGKMQDASKQT
jgi:hypothetical protein